jgi:hypothetical protein
LRSVGVDHSVNKAERLFCAIAKYTYPSFEVLSILPNHPDMSVLRIVVLALVATLAVAQAPIGGNVDVFNVTCPTSPMTGDSVFVSSTCQPYLSCEQSYCRCASGNTTAVSTAAARCTTALRATSTCATIVPCVNTFLACLEEVAITTSLSSQCGTWGTRWTSTLVRDAVAFPRNFSMGQFAGECRLNVCRMIAQSTGRLCHAEVSDNYRAVCSNPTAPPTTTAVPVIVPGPTPPATTPAPAPPATTSGVPAASIAALVAAVAVIAAL